MISASRICAANTFAEAKSIALRTRKGNRGNQKFTAARRCSAGNFDRNGRKRKNQTGADGSPKICRRIFPTEFFLSSLPPIGNPELVVAAIAQTLGLKESGEKSLLDALKNFLRERRILLDSGQFRASRSAASLVNELLSAAVFLKILVTSRVALRS